MGVDLKVPILDPLRLPYFNIYFWFRVIVSVQEMVAMSLHMLDSSGELQNIEDSYEVHKSAS